MRNQYTDVRKSLYGTHGAGPSHMSQSKPGGGSLGTSGCKRPPPPEDAMAMVFSWPIFPLRTSSQAKRKYWLERCCAPNWKTTPDCFTAARIALAFSTVRAQGFS